MDYPVVVRKLDDDDGGGYIAVVPDLYGCMADGETIEEAVTNVCIAVTDWLEVARELGREIPEPGDAARMAKAREHALIETIKIMSEQFDGLDSRVDRLMDEIQHVSEILANQDAWHRFSRITGLERDKDEGGPRSSLQA
jgi:predicted RNase H-like HicB family nuclease